MKIKSDMTGVEFEADRLWCLHCERSFAVEDMRHEKEDVPGFGIRDLNLCAYPDCNAGGIGIDLFPKKWWGNKES